MFSQFFILCRGDLKLQLCLSQQCDVCPYYFNWSEELIAHWVKTHVPHPPEEGRVFWCNFCLFQDACPKRMLEHLKSDYHTEIQAVINRSLPMHVKKLTLQSCHLCGAKFRLRLSLKRHVVKVHGVQNFQLENHQVRIPMKTMNA